MEMTAMNNLDKNIKTFEDIRHIDKMELNIGMHENYKEYQIIKNGENLMV